MRRLYLQIYASLVGILMLLALLVSFAWFYLAPEDASVLDKLAAVAADVVPGPDASSDEVEASLARLSRQIDVSLALFDERGRRVAAAGEALPNADPRWTSSRILRSRGRGLVMALRLEDGRWLVVRHHQRAHTFLALVVGMSLLAAAVALGSYPLVRRLTGRLERLQERVEALGKGELGARVAVEGKDEVAKLASSFNEAASRIERLVDAQRTLLAGASHELRSPLARIRVAVELLGEDADPGLRGRIEREIETLDELIGELILASRIETQGIRQEERIDVLALAAEEASRYGCSLEGVPAVIFGDRTLVRRLLRNLLENAHRYAPGAPIDVDVRPDSASRARGGGVRILVKDRGAGIPEAERERIFEPFYQFRNPNSPKDSAGVGLGLALVRKISRLHGGDASCRPREGGGTVFEVTLEGAAP
jgi:signal transduction histidine kinase